MHCIIICMIYLKPETIYLLRIINTMIHALKYFYWKFLDQLIKIIQKFKTAMSILRTIHSKYGRSVSAHDFLFASYSHFITFSWIKTLKCSFEVRSSKLENSSWDMLHDSFLKCSYNIKKLSGGWLSSIFDCYT